MGQSHVSWLSLAIPVIVLLVLAAVAKTRDGSSVGFPYRAAKVLFSPAERSFLGVLDQAVSPEHRVFGKVRIADVAQVESGLNRSARQGALNRIAGKHFDFVVCRASDLAVVCAVELNDKSHAGQKARARDAFVAGVCEAIKLPLLVVAAQQSYTLQDVRAQFQSALTSSRPQSSSKVRPRSSLPGS